MQQKDTGLHKPPAHPLGPGRYGEAYLEYTKRRLFVCRRNPSPKFQEAWRITEERLREMRALVASGGAGFVILVIPDEVQVDARLFDAVAAAKELAVEEYDLDYPNRRLIEFGKREGIEVIDTLPKLRERTMAGDVLYVPEDTHWNAAGNVVGAETLLEPICALLGSR